MSIFRAIYVGDIEFGNCPVFELNEETGYYVNVNDDENYFDKERVYNNIDWLIFEYEDGCPLKIIIR